MVKRKFDPFAPKGTVVYHKVRGKVRKFKKVKKPSKKKTFGMWRLM